MRWKSNAGKSTDSWLSFAKEIHSGLQSKIWLQTHPSEADWLVAMARQAGYTVNTVRRQQRTLEYLRSNLPADLWKVVEGHDISFSASELLSRLHNLNRAEAQRLLPEVVAGRMGFSRVREVFAEANASNSEAGTRMAIRIP